MSRFNPNYASIGEEFIKAFYQEYDSCLNAEERAVKLEKYYHPEALLQFEDTQTQGKEGIVGKIKGLTFSRSAHIITKADTQPTYDGGVLIVITGQLQADDDAPFGFSHIFILREESGSFFIMHEVFRLALHNFDAAPAQQAR